MSTSATIDYPPPMAVVGQTFPVRGKAAGNCAQVTVVVTSSSGTNTYDVPVVNGEYNVTVSAGTGGASVEAYCTAEGAATAAVVTGLTVSDS